MKIDDEAERLRGSIVRLGAAHGRRYPAGMKELLLAFVDRAREAGMSAGEVSRRLGVSQRQLSNWRAAVRAERPRAMVPVRVVDEPAASSTITLVSPNGFRIEGITIAQAIELLRALS